MKWRVDNFAVRSGYGILGEAHVCAELQRHPVRLWVLGLSRGTWQKPGPVNIQKTMENNNFQWVNQLFLCLPEGMVGYNFLRRPTPPWFQRSSGCVRHPSWLTVYRSGVLLSNNTLELSSSMGCESRFQAIWSIGAWYTTMWGHPVISWFRFAPVTIVISTINHSEIGVMFTNLAIVWGPHFVTTA